MRIRDVHVRPADFISNELEHVAHRRVRVLSPEVPEAPVRFDSRERGVVRVVRRVVRAPGGDRDGAAEEEGVYLVVDPVVLVLVEREQDERPVVVERGVVQERGQPELEPLRREVDRGVVAVVDHVRGDEAPLGEGGGGGHAGAVDGRSGGEVGGEVVEVADEGGARGDGSDGVVDDQRVVLADVEGVVRGRGVEVVCGGEAARAGGC